MSLSPPSSASNWATRCSLAVWSLVGAWLLALALATWSTRGGRAAWAMGSALEIVAAAVPHFWLGTVLILLFSSTLGWLPRGQRARPARADPAGSHPRDPAGRVPRPGDARIPAGCAEFALVLSARARGESEGGILWRHALRHAALPAISLSGWAFGSLVSGAVVVETVFARPGLGRSLLRAVQDRDVLLVSGIVLVVALAYCLVTVVADALDRIADPRLKATS